MNYIYIQMSNINWFNLFVIYFKICYSLQNSPNEKPSVKQKLDPCSEMSFKSMYLHHDGGTPDLKASKELRKDDNAGELWTIGHKPW